MVKSPELFEGSNFHVPQFITHWGTSVASQINPFQSECLQLFTGTPATLGVTEEWILIEHIADKIYLPKRW